MLLFQHVDINKGLANLSKEENENIHLEANFIFIIICQSFRKQLNLCINVSLRIIKCNRNN